MSEEILTITDKRTGKSYTLPIENGTVRAMDLRQIKTDADDFGLMTYDPALMNTASTKSAITFIDGNKGILEYRGYPVEQLAENCNFLQVAYLILFGELPNDEQLAAWTHDITYHTFVHESIKTLMQAFRYDAHPMGMFISTVAALSTFYPEANKVANAEHRLTQIKRLIAKVPTIAAFSYRHNRGLPYVYPNNDLSYTGQFLEHDVQDRRGEIHAESGAGTRAGRSFHFARRSRTELQHERDARDRLKPRGSLQRHGWRGSRALRSATRRGE